MRSLTYCLLDIYHGQTIVLTMRNKIMFSTREIAPLSMCEKQDLDQPAQQCRLIGVFAFRVTETLFEQGSEY